MSRPKQGKELKKVYSIRLEPKTHKKLVKTFGSLQIFIDYVVGFFL